jgi:hypothetical protein
MDILPEVCSSKKTARRFKDNAEIWLALTADREFSVKTIRYLRTTLA